MTRRCAADPQQFVEHGLLSRFRQRLVRQRKAEKRPIENLRARARARRPTNPDCFEQALDVAQPPPVDRLHGRARRGGRRVAQVRTAFSSASLLAECPAQQQCQRIVGLSGAASRLAMIRSAATSRQCFRIAAWNAADIGEMPVEAAARHAASPSPAARPSSAVKPSLGQRLEALVEPVLGRELIGHIRSCDISTIHYCIDSRQRCWRITIQSVWRALRCAISAAMRRRRRDRGGADPRRAR